MAGERQRAYLEALGIPLWLSRRSRWAAEESMTAADVVATDSAGEVADRSPLVHSTEPQEPERVPDDDWMPPMDDSWELVSDDFDPDEPIAPPTRGREARIAQMDWEELTTEARQCQSCGLCASRTQAVFGVGDRQAQWLVIGEAPGADEDRQGEPFVGRAGKLLNPMLLAIGLRREQVYIANILKCRPPENRDPTPAEAASCRPFLERQIALIQPRLILAVGRIAAQNLLDTDTQIGKLRGRVHHFGPTHIPVIVTYHPAYLLRSPREKRKAWDDLRLAQRTLAGDPATP
ncbi:MAG TPA: uracil-DNA glycosylase [Candidatus Competibacteraceae bacterium]|nr:MAG: uracil-DNA glycosylase [Candidatus Competibacteraceae bacterium]HOB62730.1 uracil-DNA glycosylase [Candidatus Competibacteraceae bacterium]HQA27369.1 uracil-DNA glycosylase [Candidatus Competibacteraceae bacterium]HQD57423.1 uracil-DNA glycosylase [Candidatus Competibacteraceae bacterium]